MRKTLTLLSYKAAEERHGDEEEKDDEENCAADHTLRLGAESIENKYLKWDNRDALYLSGVINDQVI